MRRSHDPRDGNITDFNFKLTHTLDVYRGGRAGYNNNMRYTNAVWHRETYLEEVHRGET